jgi:DNA-directed RNA polymerase subunit E'
LYVVYRVRDIIRIPPSLFDLPLEEAARRVLVDRYVGYVDPELGVIVAVYNIKVSEYGRILPGDGATYHESEFDVLAYKPVLKEVVEGVVVNVPDFGLFVSLGPIDAFIHRTQIVDEELRYDDQRRAFIGVKTGRVVEKGDEVRARIIAISMPTDPTQKPRIQLTMRQPFLGKVEWVREEVKRVEEAMRKAKKVEAR